MRFKIRLARVAAVIVFQVEYTWQSIYKICTINLRKPTSTPKQPEHKKDIKLLRDKKGRPLHQQG